MPARRRDKRRPRSNRRRPPASHAQPKEPPTPIPGQSPVATTPEESQWSALRQGARNVAGVRYQLAVTALLLAASRRGVLPFVELIPEGLEDFDCLDSRSTHWLLQVKEFGAGLGTFTASSLASVISHAASSAHISARIAAITDGQLGSHLAGSGWNRPVSETPGYDLQSTINALGRLGYSSADAHTLLRRTHLITFP